MTGEFKDQKLFKDVLRRDLEHLIIEVTHDGTAHEESSKFVSGDVKATRPPVYFLPDNLPVWYIERPKPMEALRSALLGGPRNVGVVASAALHGMGGLGKTTLALDLRRSFNSRFFPRRHPLGNTGPTSRPYQTTAQRTGLWVAMSRQPAALKVAKWNCSGL